MPVKGGASSGLAKLSRPRLAPVHPRERLFRRLDECLEHSAVWVSGVPGAGKTTLVASYLNVRKLSALWYRADSGDADPAVVCHYLRLIATRVAPQRGGRLPALAPVETDDLATFSRRYFAAFYACIGTAATLVFDDTQEALSSAGFCRLLQAAIREAPTHQRLIVVSRTRPPGDLARLLANGQLVVLGDDELLFSEEESIAVQQLSAPSSGSGGTARMRELHRLTGGWVAGLKLLLHFPNPDSPAITCRQVANDTALFAYLSTEVFERQSESVRGFLLKVAHLPHMTPATACLLGGNAEAARILERMHDDNLFTFEPLAKLPARELLRCSIHPRGPICLVRDVSVADRLT